MTEYVVGIGGDFPTLATAAKAVKPGDTVNLLSGIYKERLICNVEGVTWQAAAGHWPVLDGGWQDTVETNYAAWLQVPAEGVTVRGLTVRNVAGRGIGVTASNVRILDCRVDRTYYGGIKIGDSTKAAISGVEVRGNVFTRMSLSWVTEKNPANVDGNFNIHNVRDSIVADNILSDGWGEGINIGRGSTNVEVSNNIIHSTNHVLVYFNRCQNCVVKGNWLYHIPDPTYGGKDGNTFSAAVVFGDERGPQTIRWPNQKGNTFSGNIAVGTGVLLHVRNNALDTGGYDTVLENVVIENNTFVASAVTTKGVIIQGNQRGRQHANSAVRYNAVHFAYAQAGADIGTHGQGSGIAFERNGWTTRPPQSMRGATDIYGDLALVNPGAVIERAGDAPATTFRVDNYRPGDGSPLIGPPLIGALSPVTPEEPEPAPPLLERLNSLWNDLEQIGLSVNAAMDELEALIAELEREHNG